MRILCLFIAMVWLAAVVQAGTPAESQSLRMYFVDVEGGQATLIVAPSGEAMLIDAGYPEFDGRDTRRIVETAREAGVSRIDWLVMTHYHLDHVANVPDVARHLPMRRIVDHGDNTEPPRERTQPYIDAYYKLREGAEHIVVKPGDKIPVKGLDVTVVSARGAVLDGPLPGAGAKNPACASIKPNGATPNENAMSVGFVLEYGDFRFADFADIVWDVELGLACPVDKVGPVDLYLVTHHGIAQSNCPAIVDALRPRAAIMNNGSRKGGQPAVFETLRKSPRLRALWQLHYSVHEGAGNSDEKYIANMEDPCEGRNIVVTASRDGSFTVTNQRNGYSESYGAGK